MVKNLEVSLLLDFYGDMLTDKQKAFAGYYYNDDLSLSEIGENEGISRQGVRDSIKRAEGQLFEMEERLGLAKRFRDVQEGLEQIIAFADEIAEYNVRNGISREISDRATWIKMIAEKLSE